MWQVAAKPNLYTDSIAVCRRAPECQYTSPGERSDWLSLGQVSITGPISYVHRDRVIQHKTCPSLGLEASPKVRKLPALEPPYYFPFALLDSPCGGCLTQQTHEFSSQTINISSDL